jgi:hypothetical protein
MLEYLLTGVETIHCPYFYLGQVTVNQSSDERFDKSELVTLLARHTQCDFGEVTWEQYRGNLQLIEDNIGVITSFYNIGKRKRVEILTEINDFKPSTLIAEIHS